MASKSDEVAPGMQGAFDRSHYDVVVVGAGISGIDAGRHLKTRLPGKSFVIAERAESLGGTWRIHRYPGARSDSDLHTFGYGWKPWTGRELAKAHEIVAYLEEAVAEEGLAPHIRYGQGLVAADWSDAAARWTLTFEDRATGARAAITAGFLWMCNGYYDPDRGHEPDFPGRARFPGPVIHPQRWPEGEDFAGKRVAVIGSGATAATLIPALAGRAAHVTMVQRSPTYYLPRPAVSELGELLKPLDLPPALYHDLMRRKAIHDTEMLARRAREAPEELRAELLAAARAHLGDAAPVSPHFSPRYPPWRQRLAVIPEGDLYAAIRRGEASVVTGEIETFTETGLTMADGTEVAADAIVTATGLRLTFLGEIPFSRNGAPIDWPATWTWRGIMATGAPNMAWVFGYLRASWTLRADLVAELVCRLLAHMDERGAAVVEPRLRPGDRDMPARLMIEPDNFNPGYVMRGIDRHPRQGDRPPWTAPNDFEEERRTIPAADLEDGALAYAPAPAAAKAG